MVRLLTIPLYFCVTALCALCLYATACWVGQLMVSGVQTMVASGTPSEAVALKAFHVPLPRPNEEPAPAVSQAVQAVSSGAIVGIEPGAADELSGDLYNVTANVNVRAKASKESDRLSTLAAGDRVSVVDRDGGWVKVARDGVEVGWIFSRYITPVATRSASAI
jgi:uncharacterized protein YgiM (DUF1202 family)